MARFGWLFERHLLGLRIERGAWMIRLSLLLLLLSCGAICVQLFIYFSVSFFGQDLQDEQDGECARLEFC
jgi:hypothetical protein